MRRRCERRSLRLLGRARQQAVLRRKVVAVRRAGAEPRPSLEHEGTFVPRHRRRASVRGLEPLPPRREAGDPPDRFRHLREIHLQRTSARGGLPAVECAHRRRQGGDSLLRRGRPSEVGGSAHRHGRRGQHDTRLGISVRNGAAGTRQRHGDKLRRIQTRRRNDTRHLADPSQRNWMRRHGRHTAHALYRRDRRRRLLLSVLRAVVFARPLLRLLRPLRNARRGDLLGARLLAQALLSRGGAEKGVSRLRLDAANAVAREERTCRAGVVVRSFRRPHGGVRFAHRRGLDNLHAPLRRAVRQSVDRGAPPAV